MKYSYFDSIKSRQCEQVTVGQLVDKLRTPYIQGVAEGVLKHLDEGNEEAASTLKCSLPVIVLGQLYEQGQPRSKNGGKPTGLLMIDYDDCKTKEEAQQLMQHIKEKWLSDILLRDLIVAAHYSPRMHGVHIWYRWIDGCHSYAECNERIAKLLERPDYDLACKDNSRCSFLVPISYFEIQNWDAMANNEKFALLQELQEKDKAPLPPKGEFGKVTGTSVGELTGNPQTNRMATPPSGDGGLYPKEYNGVSYEEIVKRLTKACALKSQLNEDGSVRQGARNNTFFKVVCLLRYLCDNNAEWIYSISPQWALDMGREQAMLTINSAIKRNLSYSMPKTLASVLNNLDKPAIESDEDMQKHVLEEMNNVDASIQRFLKFPKKLPPIFQQFCDGVKPEWKAAVVMTLLPTLGTIMSKVRARYIDQRLHSPSFQTVIEAKMSSGKQNYADIAEFILTPVTEKDLEGNTQLNLFNEKAFKANGTKALEDMPDVCVRKMIGKFTEAGLNEVLKTSKGLHIWSGVSEIDEVASVWKELSYILRLAYDNSGYGRTLQSARQFRGERKLFLNTFICGTPRAIARVYNDPEDGLVSRTMFFKLFVETPGVPITKVSQKQKDSMLKLIKKIHDRYTIDDENNVAQETIIELQYVINHMQKWLNKKSVEGVKLGSEAIERFRRRDACNGFRAGMVAHVIYQNYNKNGKLTDADKNVVKGLAEWVAEYSLMTHDYKFGKELDEILDEDNFKARTKKDILSGLPDTFNLAEAYRALPQHSRDSIRKILSRQVEKGLLNKVDIGIFSKK